ncbi:MAG: invertase Pin-like site-specific recombinase [Acidimicrobiales bacterium]|nr:invertase Pin-like site-specific recombinase [Acidimicrobiales bacterium]
MRVAIYARVSSDAQEARGTIGSQVEALRARMAAEGHEVVAEFLDDGFSGARLDRPGLDALRDAAEAGVFEAVWCLTPDRLARSYAYQMLVLDELARFGCAVRFADAPPIDDDPQARLLTQMQGVIAEYERAKIAERHRRGKLFRVRAGEAIFWKVPFGYRRVPRSADGPARLEVYEPEAVVVRRIFDDYVAAGCSMREISRRLYEDGIASPGGRDVWASSTLGGLLRNRTYMGTAEWFRRETVAPPRPGYSRGRQGPRPQEDWIRVPVPAIVGEDLFEAAQRIKRDNSMFSPRRTLPGTWLLRGLVVCGACDVKAYAQQMSSSAEGGQKKNRYYTCSHHDPLKAGGPDKRCRERRIRADELDAFVFAQVREVLLRPEMLLAGEEAVATQAPVPDDEILGAQLDRLARRVDEAAAERRRLADLYQAGLIDMADLTRRATEVEARRRQFESQRTELSAQRHDLATGQRLRQRVAHFAERAAEGIDALDFDQRQRLLRLVVEQVRVTGWQVELRLRVPLDDDPEAHRPKGPTTERRRQSRCDRVFTEERLRSLGGRRSAALRRPGSSSAPMRIHGPMSPGQGERWGPNGMRCGGPGPPGARRLRRRGPAARRGP